MLNCTNILTHCNTGHYSAELINSALLPLFESGLLSTDNYYSMCIGRICAVLDSFIGRGYKLDDNEVTTVCENYAKLQKAIKDYPLQSLEYHKDKLAEQLVKDKPCEVKMYLEKQVKDLQSAKFLTMREVCNKHYECHDPSHKT